MEDDTLETPELGQEPEPEVQEPEQEVQEPESEHTEAYVPTAEDVIRQAGEHAFQRMASWQGRRDKDLLDNVGRLIESKINHAKPAEETTLYDDPDGWINRKFQETMPKMVDQEIQRRTSKDQQYTSEVIQHAGRLMDVDPLFADRDLGNEVINEVQKIFKSVNKGVSPDISAQLLVSNAYSNVMRKRSAKTNPLSKNKGANGVGGIKAPTSLPPKVKPVKLTDAAQRLAKRWNYSEDDLGKVFGE